MIFRRFFAPLLALLATSFVFGATATKPTRPTNASDGAYKGAIVVDAATGNVLFEDHADIVSPPASMTKLMTFAVLHDKIASGALALDTPITVMAADSKIGGTQVWLKEKEIFPVEELIYAMIIQSANDASFALARTAAGSVPAFVELMNAKAQELGMTKTTFRTPHGLPPANRKIAEGDLTSPRDFALLSRYLIQKTNILKYSAVETRDFGPPWRGSAVKMDTHNNLIGHVAGVDGLKTGFTGGAGYCLAATAQRNGRRIIVVTMGSPASTTRDLKVTELIERGFVALPPVPTIAMTEDSGSSPIVAAPPLNKTAPTKAPASENPPPIKVTIPRSKK